MIHSEAAVSSLEKIFANQILAEMERNARLVLFLWRIERKYGFIKNFIMLACSYSKINFIYSLVTIVVDQTDQFVPAHLEPEETHWENVPRVNVNMTMNVEVNEPVTTSDAQIPVPMHVVKELNVEPVIMAQFARVQEYVFI